MLFNSYEFILAFLPVSTICYYLLNHLHFRKAALATLILSSLVFYAGDNIRFLSVLCGSIAVNWMFASGLNYVREKSNNFSKLFLIAGILVDLGLLFYFKYYNFFLENVNQLFHTSYHGKNILLPLGISFFTFQQISFLVDTMKGETKDYGVLEYAAFVSFFPQLVAGPIVLHGELIPQFRDRNRWKFDFDSFAQGIYVFSIGLCKKVIVADTFGRVVTWGYGQYRGIAEALTSLELIIVMLSYSFQIYFDFSGYCDMAKGIAGMFHLELPSNFNSPYKALSIADFWKRWHITLTRFLRTYVYIPLGGNRKGKIRTYANTLIVFFISGLWHGANWTFVIWGGCHGIAMMLYRAFADKWDKLNSVFRWWCTFVFVNFTWLIFRSDSIGQVTDIIKKILRFESFSLQEALLWKFAFWNELDLLNRIPVFSIIREYVYGFDMWLFLFIAFCICLNCKNLYEEKFRPTVAKAIGSSIMLFWSIISLEGVSTFIYFNF